MQCSSNAHVDIRHDIRCHGYSAWKKFDDITVSFFAVLQKPDVLRGGEGVSRCTVKASLGENGQSAHSGEDDKEHEEHAVHDHGDILPVLLQLEGDGRARETAGRRGKVRVAKEIVDKKSTYGFVVFLSLQGLGDVCDRLYRGLQLLR